MRNPEVNDRERQLLLESAHEGLRNALPVITGYRVGAAVLVAGGRVYKGCNVESVIAGLGTCAERCAVDNAVSSGDRDVVAVLVVSDAADPIAPCGACLQYLAEFGQRQGIDPVVVSIGKSGAEFTARLSELLPRQFGPNNLKGSERVR